VGKRSYPTDATHSTCLTHLTYLSHSTRSTSAAAIVWLLLSAVASAQALSVSAQDDPPPTELADPIEALMATGGLRVSSGGKVLEFWWVKSLPLKPASTDVTWSAVEEGTLVGTVRLSDSYLDIRGKTIKPGIYTLRYGIQPQNGDHLGVSPYRDFLLLSPAATDNATSALGHDGTIAIAKQTLGASHPACWSIDPPVVQNVARGSIRQNDAGQYSVMFSVAVSRDGRDAGTLEFGLMLIGTIQP
jgi:hypothetical protein